MFLTKEKKQKTKVKWRREDNGEKKTAKNQKAKKIENKIHLIYFSRTYMSNSCFL